MLDTKRILLVSGLPQSDMAETDETKPSYIKNKPTTLEGYGITDAATLKDLIVLNTRVSTAEDKILALESIDVEKSIINSVDENQFAVDAEGKLTLLDITIGKIVDLPKALDSKVNIIEGKGLSTNDFTDEFLSKLNDIEVEAQVNDLEVVKIAGTELSIFDKGVDIPMATIDTFGVVIGSTEENKVFVGEDGTMELNSVNVDKLVQTEGTTLTLNSGSSAV